MATEVNMPKLGFDMEEGAIANWLKDEGDTVEKGEVIAEVETDKATVEMEAPDAGVLLSIVVGAGERVPVFTTVAYIGEEGEEVPTGDGAAEEAPAAEEPAVEAADVEEAPSDEDIKATPVARRLADEEGVDLSRVTGTGSSGRITKDDVQKALEGVEEAEEFPPPDGVKASPAARSLAEELGVDIAKVEGTGPGGRIVRDDVQEYAERVEKEVVEVPAREAPAPTVEVQHIGDAEEAELTRMRRRIAQVMTSSKGPVPHFYVTMEIDMEEALELRKQMNATLEDEGLKISVNDLIVKGAALALKQFPNINASFAGDTVVRHGDINVGIAVAVDEGLLTVVTRNTDQKSLSQISQETRAKAGRAREGRVQPDDLGGSTFTVSNLGMYGVDDFIAVITPPEAAILAVGAVQEKPVVRDGEIVVGHTMKVTISADHRVTDGAEAAEFLVAFKKLLENPMRLML